MDKIAANNHFVLMRKEIKKAKAMVSGNLIRKIAKLKLERDKLEDEAKIEKIDAKIATILEETKQLKHLDPYTIAKNSTLKPDPKLWTRIISDSRATTEEILTARIIIKNNIQKQVVKFRTDYKDCDEWINEYIEYREKKRDIEDASKSKTKSFKERLMKKNIKNIEGNQENSKNKSLSIKRGPFKTATKKVEETDIDDREESRNHEVETETLHPSWEIKRKEKEVLKAALAGKLSKPKSIKFE